MPDTSPSPSSLESVPLHILEDIVHQLDQLSIWRMRKTSRYIRDIADTALEPFLDDIKVIGNPPIIKHGELPSQEARRKEGWNGLELIAVFKPVDPELLNTLRERHSRLKRKNKLLHSHLTVHPRTAPSTLTVEVRDDDERTGWRVLRRVEPRNLELHIVDRYCTQQQFELDGLEQDEGVDEQDDWCDWWNDTPDLMLDYNRYNGILGSPEKSRFDSLQSFTVAATSRGLHHLRQLAPYLPNLRELTFSCHWSGDYGYTIFTDIEGGLRLPMLECLTVSGCDTNYAAFAAGRIALHARRLSKVVLHSAAYNARQFSAGFDSMVVDLAKRTALCSIALYGYMARFFLDKAARWRHEVTYPFPHLTSIALERYHDGVHASPVNPLMDDASRFRLLLAKLMDRCTLHCLLYFPLSSPSPISTPKRISTACTISAPWIAPVTRTSSMTQRSTTSLRQTQSSDAFSGSSDILKTTPSSSLRARHGRRGTCGAALSSSIWTQRWIGRRPRRR